VLPIVTAMFLASAPLVVILNKVHCTLGEKQGSVQFSVAEVERICSAVTFNIALTSAKQKLYV